MVKKKLIKEISVIKNIKSHFLPLSIPLFLAAVGRQHIISAGCTSIQAMLNTSFHHSKTLHRTNWTQSKLDTVQIRRSKTGRCANWTQAELDSVQIRHTPTSTRPSWPNDELRAVSKKAWRRATNISSACQIFGNVKNMFIFTVYFVRFRRCEIFTDQPCAINFTVIRGVLTLGYVKFLRCRVSLCRVSAVSSYACVEFGVLCQVLLLSSLHSVEF